MKKRIIIWIVCLAIAVGYIVINEYIKGLPEENTIANELHIYNDVASESLLRKIFDQSGLSSKYSIEFEDDEDNADCIITQESKLLSDKDKTFVTSYTPLIVCLKNSKDLQKYQKNGLLISSEDIENSVEDEITIDFKKLITAVINGDNWSVFGGDDKDFKIIVPESDSVEGKIFYNFLLVTINDGNYPSNDEDLNSAKETADEFLKVCVETENAINDLKHINSINATDIYVLFEADFINSSIWSQKSIDISVAYPKVTMVKHMYIQEGEEENEELDTFFASLSQKLNYRTSNNHSFTEYKNYNVNDDITFVEVIDEDIDEDAWSILDTIITFFMIVVLLLVVWVLAS